MAAVAQAGARRRRERELQMAFEDAMQLRRMRPPEAHDLRAMKVRELDGEVARTAWLLDELRRQGWEVNDSGKAPLFGQLETYRRVGAPVSELVEFARTSKPSDVSFERVFLHFMGYTKTVQITPPLRRIGETIRALQTLDTAVRCIYPSAMRTSYQQLERRLRDPGLVRRLLLWLRYDAKRMRIADARNLLLSNLPAPLMLVRSGSWSVDLAARRLWLSGDKVCALYGAREANRALGIAVHEAERAAWERESLLRGPGPGRLP